MRRSKPSVLALVVACTVVLAALVLGACGGSSSSLAASSERHPRTVNAGQQGAHGRRTAPLAARSRLVRNAIPQPGWRPYTGPVPILVYHDLGTPPPTEDYPGLYVPDSEFEAEIAWLHQQGYQAVTLDEMMNAWFHGGTLPSKPIVITFDNGYIPQATLAPAVLSRYGWPGVLNEITEGHLDNARLESLIELGWEIDSHSLTHPDLTTLDPAELQQQVAGSREFLRKTFHIPVNSFCYPSSKYDAAVVAAVKAAGYTNAVTENTGYATRDEVYTLPRFEIEGGQGVSGLAADLAQGP